MRGKHLSKLEESTTDRIIPAHAGQTAFGRASAYAGPDHPRACGANHSVPFQVFRFVGSSPRMRGKPFPELHQYGKGRIIPAHAGQTPLPDPAHRVRTDHPRACGANCHVCYCLRLGAGSSPRMRGKLADCGCFVGSVRIIPAHAGQTTAIEVAPNSATDHPRACGAN